ncbi:MAG: hypothetical protein KDD61_09915 [Bdellovibrionales bacterium]|nr:hypothetical protein [Bdellovibrionales bacterium]
MKSVLNHIAILVESIESVVGKIQVPKSHLGVLEEFPSEGTKEMYIGGSNQMGRLLLMQAIGDGPYKRAMEKRGPGIHHIALDVLSIDSFVSNLSGSGWLLHPKSLEFYSNHRSVFLCRQNVPVLIEVQERKKLEEDNFFISELELPFGEERLMNSLLCDRLKIGVDIKMKIGNEQVLVRNLV